MKRVFLAVTFVAATVSVAFAQSAPVRLSPAAIAQIKTFVPNADLNNLTNTQYARFVLLLSSSENLRSGENPAGAIKVILNAQ